MRTQSFAAILAVSALLILGCDPSGEPLPEPRHAESRNASICGELLPPPPPPPMLLESPSDLSNCLAGYRHPYLPIEMKVGADGRLRPQDGLGFYQQCSGTTFEVDSTTQRCLLDHLRSWRWVLLKACAADTNEQIVHLTVLRPPRGARAKARAAAPTTPGGCGT